MTGSTGLDVKSDRTCWGGLPVWDIWGEWTSGRSQSSCLQFQKVTSRLLGAICWEVFSVVNADGGRFRAGVQPHPHVDRGKLVQGSGQPAEWMELLEVIVCLAFSLLGHLRLQLKYFLLEGQTGTLLGTCSGYL